MIEDSEVEAPRRSRVVLYVDGLPNLLCDSEVRYAVCRRDILPGLFLRIGVTALWLMSSTQVSKAVGRNRSAVEETEG